MKSGILYVVATPIGNLEDFSTRAIRILNEVDQILAEDTRHSAVLLDRYGIDTPVVGYHEHNEHKLIPHIIEKLKSGVSIALISDAGTPLINDPGYDLVKQLHSENIRIVPVPGPSAVITALSVSGLPTDRFVYEGFLPARATARRKRLDQLAGELRTLVFYEVPHRICDTLKDMIGSFGPGREVVLAKELTKQFENIRKDNLENLLHWLNEKDEHKKGEFVVIVSGESESGIEETECRRVLGILMETMTVKDAAGTAARILDENKNRLYQLALDINNNKNR